MKRTTFSLLILLLISGKIFAQKQDPLVLKNALLRELAANACSCIDSIDTYNKTKEEVSAQISKCISKQVSAYQLGVKLSDINNDSIKNKNDKKRVDITLNLDENSNEYKAYYYEMERYMLDSCNSLKQKVAVNEKQTNNAFSKVPEAVKLYNDGVIEAQNGNYQNAINLYKQALKLDPKFAFAWDNLGLCYRKLEDFDKALDAYKKSLALDSNNVTPLQNMAVVYRYKKDYSQAIQSYQKLATIDKNNPEVYYGLGEVYAFNLNDYEKGLDNMCKAYSLYIAQKSPYRSDAEKLMSEIYSEMKKEGKEKVFMEILKQNKIQTTN